MPKRNRLVLFSELSSRGELDQVLPRTGEDEEPPTLADEALLAETIWRAVQELSSPRLRALLVLRFGLLGCGSYSPDELATILRCRREYVLACYHAAVRRLRNRLLRNCPSAAGPAAGSFPHLWEGD
jgi:hypothetical protein